MKAFTHVLLVALFFTGAYAEDTAKKEKLTPTELQVMAHYQAVNKLEVDLGKAAIKNGGSQPVKSYGEMMVKEHTATEKQMVGLAKQMGQTIPAAKPATEAEKQAMADGKKQAAAIKKLKGAEFDRQYLQMMVDSHDRELANIDTKMAEVQNPQLADMLKHLKPALQHHADQAREIQKGMAQASTDAPAPPVAKAPGTK